MGTLTQWVRANASVKGLWWRLAMPISRRWWTPPPAPAFGLADPVPRCSRGGPQASSLMGSPAASPHATPIRPGAPASDAWPLTSHVSSVTHSPVRPFVAALWLPQPRPPLLRPLLTSRSDISRRAFTRKARSPRVRTHSFAAQPPDLRRLALITRASRFHARSPCLATPSIPFFSIGSQFMLHASFPHSVTLVQLRFTSFVVINLRRDLHP